MAWRLRRETLSHTRLADYFVLPRVYAGGIKRRVFLSEIYNIHIVPYTHVFLCVCVCVNNECTRQVLYETLERSSSSTSYIRFLSAMYTRFSSDVAETWSEAAENDVAPNVGNGFSK